MLLTKKRINEINEKKKYDEVTVDAAQLSVEAGNEVAQALEKHHSVIRIRNYF
jgi:hypothetical protein